MWQLFYYKMPQKLLQNVAVFLLQHTTDFLQNAQSLQNVAILLQNVAVFTKC